MCGIFGHTEPGKTALETSRRALHTLAHRGPDQWSDWADERVYLGHQRLSIMDLSKNGQQPMADPDNEVLVTVNGEIYNFEHLKATLTKKYAFKSTSDSEVLLYGYREWGIETLLSRLEGMYAFVLYDAAHGKLFIARDRVGIKPLYYSLIDQKIAWASELKALVAFHTPKALDIDTTAIYDFLTYSYVPTPKTLYQDIYKLEPGHYLELDLQTNKMDHKRYWRLCVSEQHTSLAEASSRVRELVEGAVRDQLMSDVPVGFFLSGGMDSSTVVAVAAGTGAQLHTYSIGFDIKEHDETHYAQLVADRYKTTHIRQEIAAPEVRKSFSNLRTWYDEPFADTSAFPVYQVAKLAKATSTVVLTGDGGDEVFGGYNWYKQFEAGVADYVEHKRPKGRLKNWRQAGSRQRRTEDLELEYYATLMGGLTSDQKTHHKHTHNIPEDYDDYWHYRKYYRPELPLYTRLQYLDFHTYLPDDILTKVDRASMAVGLECRVPLLATALIEFLFSLPEDIRYRGGELKGLMKYTFQDILPAEIITRAKKGFSIPTGRWRAELMGRNASMPEFILDELYGDMGG